MLLLSIMTKGSVRKKRLQFRHRQRQSPLLRAHPKRTSSACQTRKRDVSVRPSRLRSSMIAYACSSMAQPHSPAVSRTDSVPELGDLHGSPAELGERRDQSCCHRGLADITGVSSDDNHERWANRLRVWHFRIIPYRLRVSAVRAGKQARSQSIQKPAGLSLEFPPFDLPDG